MAASFFFYDLETSGRDPRTSRIMQFAGQRTNMDLETIGPPINELIRLTPDVLPEPEAVLLTGITPQKTIAEGLSEAVFLKLFYKEVTKPDTIFVGFNNIRFDDEFIRFLNYRNFYDAYGWHWEERRSRWDLLDVVRLTRALRPDGIKWPVNSEGKPTNRLELLSKLNRLSHDQAHDALSDVMATIAVAHLLRQHQPALFDFQLAHRSKKAVARIVATDHPFVYTSGHFPSEYLHTTAVVRLLDHPHNEGALVYDLRVDPTPFLSLSIDELVEAWRFSRDPKALRLPIKTLKYNRCPAVAPLGVMKAKATQERLGLTLKVVETNWRLLKAHKEQFMSRVSVALTRLDEERAKEQAVLIDNPLTVDTRLYDGFMSPADARLLPELHRAAPEELSAFAVKFHDERLRQLLPLYKARNYPEFLMSEEHADWEQFREMKLLGGEEASAAAHYFSQLHQLSETRTNPEQQYLIEELRLYGQSILPTDEATESK